jgi:hypothetical protein
MTTITLTKENFAIKMWILYDKLMKKSEFEIVINDWIKEDLGSYEMVFKEPVKASTLLKSF